MNKGERLSKKYADLRNEVETELKKRIIKNNVDSEHYHYCKVIKLNGTLYGYTELAIINDKLAFLDKDGYQFSIYADCTLEDLIDILI
jgi:hypothetical protein